MQTDPELGWVSSPLKSGLPNRWKSKVTILPDGTRSNGSRFPTADRPTVLAVGDSFTFGDEFSDSDTWPAALERRLGSRVVNAGMCGYGLDQSLLRAEKLVPQLKPAVLVYSLFWLSITYSEWASQPATHYLPKPYFVVEKTGLRLHQSPTPPADPIDVKLDTAHWVLGHSYLIDRLAAKAVPKWWTVKPLDAQVTGQKGTQIGCAILDRLKAFSRRQNVRTIVLLQHRVDAPPIPTEEMAQIRDCAEQAGLEVVDTRPAFDALMRKQPGEMDKLWGGGHMNRAGNEFIASLVTRQISKPPPSPRKLARSGAASAPM